MLNKGLRDQESIRIDNILKMLHSLTFVPKYLADEDKVNIEKALKNLGLTIQTLKDFTSKDLIVHLNRLHLEWNQLEKFADFLIQISKVEKYDFQEKAVAIYNHIQSESKTFSFEISNKIASNS